MKSLSVRLNNRTIVIIGVLFSILNLGFILTENFWGLLLPFGVALVAAILMALDKVLLFLVFSTPLSIFYYNPDLHIGFTLPTEPILFGVMLLFFVKLLYEGSFDSRIWRHPVSLAIMFHIFWLFITSITSEIPFVSFKYLIARIWFVVVFFYLMSQMLKRPRYQKLFFWLYLIPLAAVVLYTMYVHGQHGFTKDTSTWVMFPFFKEHTSYGAVLAMYIPIAFVFAFVSRHGLNNRFLGAILFVILMAGVILSFTRAAWLSLAVALGLLALIKIRPRWEVLTLLVLAGLGTLWFVWGDLEERFAQNEQVSSDNLTEHVESMSNISTDASNLERINRWKSAVRMFEERPVVGFGPGTYMFLYAPYQKPYEKTIISTNAGNMGNAHSEYIGPLAESGVLGSLSIIVIIALSIATGVRVYYRLEDHDMRYLALAALLGLVTYWTHGFLNNFLEMDKASCPVWGFTAFLVVLDCYFVPEVRAKA